MALPSSHVIGAASAEGASPPTQIRMEYVCADADPHGIRVRSRMEYVSCAPPDPSMKHKASPAACYESRLGVLSMLALVFQGTGLSLTLRFSRVAEVPYLPSVAVFWTEIIKLVFCFWAQVIVSLSETKSKEESEERWQKRFSREGCDIIRRSVPLSVPAAMFVLQQVLVIIAASNLDAVMFQIFSQSFKIIPTALFAVWLLGQRLSPPQWASLPVLVIGVVLVTLNKSSGSGVDSGNWVVGMLASSLSGLSSAFAGVYFEKYVKGGEAVSLWVRNLQLSLYGATLSAGYALVKDFSSIRESGLMQGFGAWAWGVVALQVFGGLTTGVVVKYTDNVLKNFANAVSVIFTVVLAVPILGLEPSIYFIFGVAAVLSSVYLYSLGSSPRISVAKDWIDAEKKGIV